MLVHRCIIYELRALELHAPPSFLNIPRSNSCVGCVLKLECLETPPPCPVSFRHGINLLFQDSRTFLRRVFATSFTQFLATLLPTRVLCIPCIDSWLVSRYFQRVNHFHDFDDFNDSPIPIFSTRKIGDTFSNISEKKRTERKR